MFLLQTLVFTPTTIVSCLMWQSEPNCSLQKKKKISQLHQPHVCSVSQPLQVVWSSLVAKCDYWKSGCERLLLLLCSICSMREEPSSTCISCLSRQTADLVYIRLRCCGVFLLSQSAHGAHDSVCMWLKCNLLEGECIRGLLSMVCSRNLQSRWLFNAMNIFCFISLLFFLDFRLFPNRLPVHSVLNT